MNDKDQQTHRLAILTSGGDAPGMNAALRAAVRTALEEGLEVVAIREGYRGLVEGGDAFRPMDWDTVGGIMHKGGTVIGTARCDDFREREGRLRAAQNLVEHGIVRINVGQIEIGQTKFLGQRLLCGLRIGQLHLHDGVAKPLGLRAA